MNQHPSPANPQSDEHTQIMNVDMLALIMFASSIAFLVYVYVLWIHVPVHERIFMDFDTELPELTLLVISFRGSLFSWPVLVVQFLLICLPAIGFWRFPGPFAALAFLLLTAHLLLIGMIIFSLNLGLTQFIESMM